LLIAKHPTETKDNCVSDVTLCYVVLKFVKMWSYFAETIPMTNFFPLFKINIRMRGADIPLLYWCLRYVEYSQRNWISYLFCWKEKNSLLRIRGGWYVFSECL